MKKTVFALVLLTQGARTIPPENILSAPTFARVVEMSESPCHELQESANDCWQSLKECVEVVRGLPAFVLFLERQEQKIEGLRWQRNGAYKKARDSRALVRNK